MKAFQRVKQREVLIDPVSTDAHRVGAPMRQLAEHEWERVRHVDVVAVRVRIADDHHFGVFE